MLWLARAGVADRVAVGGAAAAEELVVAGVQDRRQTLLPAEQCGVPELASALGTIPAYDQLQAVTGVRADGRTSDAWS